MDNSLLIEASGISLAFGGRAVLSGVSLCISKGEIVTLIGPNGAGKTTLSRVILGLIKQDCGSVVCRPRLSVGYAPQNLDPNPSLPMTAGRFLGINAPRSLSGKASSLSNMEKRMSALHEVGAGHLFDSQLAKISCGELKRVMLARALLREPDLLVLDEPAQGVDVGGQAELYRLIGRIRDQRGCGVLLVSHDLHLVMAATDRVICLNRHICCEGHPHSVARDPAFANLFGADLFGADLFGSLLAGGFAVYQHQHDHSHDSHGDIIPLSEAPLGEIPLGEEKDHG